MTTVTKAKTTWQPGRDSTLNHVVPGQGGCLLWVGSLMPGGYGRTRIKVDGRWKGAMAHRLSYEEHVGPIPARMVIDHLCRTTRCVNPQHLEAVTSAENIRRAPWHNSMALKAKTHCPQGHPYDESNTIHSKTGTRDCRACKRDRARARYEKRQVS